MTDRVLVTGGTGYLGGWCIVEALRRGYQVRTTVRDLAKAEAVRSAVRGGGVSADALEIVAANLSSDDGWAAAMTGVDYVLHVASPISPVGVKSVDDYVRPAVDGALRVLQAAKAADVKRVVLTSSCSAVAPSVTTRETTSDETIWTDPKTQAYDGYRLSKTLAERAAWNFAQAQGIELATVLPAAIFGPVLGKEGRSSVTIIQRLIDGAMPGIPNFGICVVDVRDVAALHLLAMTTPQAAGERFIASGKFMWMREIAQTLRERLGARAGKVPTKRLPDVAIRAGAIFNPELRPVARLLGRLVRYSSAKAERVLGWQRRREEDTVVDCAESLLAL